MLHISHLGRGGHAQPYTNENTNTKEHKYTITQIQKNTNTTAHLPSLTLAGAVTHSPPPIFVEMSWKILTTSSSESFNSTGHKAGEISQHWWWMAGIGTFHSDFSPAPGAPDHQKAALHQLVAPSSPELKATCGSGRSASSSSSVSNKPPSSSVLHVCAYYSQPALHNMSLCWRRRADRPAAASIKQDMRVRLSQDDERKRCWSRISVVWCVWGSLVAPLVES